MLNSKFTVEDLAMIDALKNRRCVFLSSFADGIFSQSYYNSGFCFHYAQEQYTSICNLFRRVYSVILKWVLNNAHEVGVPDLPPILFSSLVFSHGNIQPCIYTCWDYILPAPFLLLVPLPTQSLAFLDMLLTSRVSLRRSVYPALARAASSTTRPHGLAAILEKKPDDVVITFAKRTAVGRAKKGQLKDTPVDEMLHALFKVSLVLSRMLYSKALFHAHILHHSTGYT